MNPREGSGPLQVIPQGLLGFFNLKSQGHLPSVLPDTVQAVLELRDWYFETSAAFSDVVAQLTRTTFGGGFLGFTNPLTVPAREYWWVDSYLVRATVGAADIVNQLRPMYELAGFTNRYSVLGSSDSGTLNGGASGAGVLAVGSQGFWVPPGAQLGCFVANLTSGAGVLLQADCRYTRLPI